jgi:Resolvase, N terminal domain
MDRVRDLVAGGGVCVVLAQDRDRFAREPAYHYLFKREFEEHGTKIRALNDRGDDTPEGELTDGILDQLGKYERAKISERSRRGKLQKARQGKVMAGPRPPYGFRYNDARDNYVVDAEKMRLIERIFRMVGAEGYIMNPTRLDFNREGVQPPPAVGFGPRSTCARPLGASIREWFGSTKLPPHDQGMRHHARSGSPCPCRYLKPDAFDLYNIEYRCGDSQIHHQAAPSRAQAAGAAVIGGP